jgi:glucose-6-phosphate 1-dehydrogenase
MSVVPLPERAVSAVEPPLLETSFPLRPEPCAFVIVGATGDLTCRKLMPALHDLALRGMLPTPFAVVGLAREPLTTDQWRERMEAAVRLHGHAGGDTDRWRRVVAEMHYIPSDFADTHAYRQLAQTLARLDGDPGIEGNRLYYLAAPPGTYSTIARLLGRHREGRGWTRLIVEKPFGYDLSSARELNELLHRRFDEGEIFRIDHYPPSTRRYPMRMSG